MAVYQSKALFHITRFPTLLRPLNGTAWRRQRQKGKQEVSELSRRSDDSGKLVRHFIDESFSAALIQERNKRWLP
jgi:hypothetical protein